MPGLLYIQGACNMYPGVTVADRKGNNYFGGGVTVQGGEFHMYGGAIDNCGITGGSMCYGGGVAVIYGGSFIMNGGKITNCFATSSFKATDYGMDSRIITSTGGGVYVSGGSSFVVNDGTISNNKANEMGGGIAVVASIDEIINGGWGNLASSAQILGGTICSNQANDGAGVFASAYFYAAAYGLCADTPNVSAAEKPGLFIGNEPVTINNNTANQDEGYGAGVLAVMLASPAKAEIRSCSITGNSGAVGGGMTSYVGDVETPYGSFTNLVIDSCVITGNHATTYGGGFAAKSNSSQNAGTVVTNTQLCNNTAGKAASDVYLDNSPLKLQSAQTMDSLYQGKPDDVTGKKIDSWYIDDESLRYTEQTKEQRSEFTGYADIAASDKDKTCLIAAANPDGDNPNKPGKNDEPDTDTPGDNKPDKDNQKPGADDQKPGGTDSDQKPGAGDKDPGDINDDQSNKDNADNNDGDNDATNNGDASNAENVIPATGDAASTLVIASLLITCCALAVAVIAKRKQSNL